MNDALRVTIYSTSAVGSGSFFPPKRACEELRGFTGRTSQNRLVQKPSSSVPKKNIVVRVGVVLAAVPVVALVVVVLLLFFFYARRYHMILDSPVACCSAGVPAFLLRDGLCPAGDTQQTALPGLGQAVLQVSRSSFLDYAHLSFRT